MKLENTLNSFDDTKHRNRSIRHDAGKQFLTNLLYMVPLGDTMKMIVPFYWNAGKKIIDVTAGKRLIWKNFLYNCQSACGYKHWHVEFNDLDKGTKATYHTFAEKLDKLKKHWDILVCDFPFIEQKDGMESFGVRTRQQYKKGIPIDKNTKKPRREFYFKHFIPPEINFHKAVYAFNKVADNLIIKMGDSHQNKVLIPNHWFAILNFDKRINPRSMFYLVDDIIYRGVYSSRGGKFPFAQSVYSHYLIFKKEPSLR